MSSPVTDKMLSHQAVLTSISIFILTLTLFDNQGFLAGMLTDLKYEILPDFFKVKLLLKLSSQNQSAVELEQF